MSARLSTKLSLDGSQHNSALREAAKELSSYKRQVESTDKQMRAFQMQSKTASGAISTFAKSFKDGNIDGMLVGGSNAMKMFSKSFLGIAGIATTGVTVSAWLQDTISKSVNLAEEAEGVRLAFERLNQPDLLNNLRKETHNTVTDVELMKQAVKFNDFNLDINKMGTFLAFAQQKAKDTGQSIDYMVDSIVTGLGRKSLPILDNLGLSSAEIKKEMEKTGDMTTAVAEIIKKRMAEAGDYVETAADRAAKKETELNNAMEELGRTFQPLTETAGEMFHKIQLGAINALKAMRPLIDMLTEAGRVRQQMEGMGGDAKIDRMIKYLGSGKGLKAKNTYNRQVKEFDDYIKRIKFKIAAFNFNGAGDAIDRGHKARLEEKLKAALKMREKYIKKAQELHKKATTPVVQKTKNEDEDTPKSTKSGSKKNTPVYSKGQVGWYKEQIESLNAKINFQSDPASVQQIKKQIAELQRKKDNLENPINFAPIDLSGLSAAPITGSIKPIDMTKIMNIHVPDLSEQYQEINDKIHKVLDMNDMGIIGAKKAQELIDALNEQLESLGLKPIKIHVESDAEKAISDIGDITSKVGDSFSQLGQALQMPELDVAGLIAQTIGNIMLGFGQATAQAGKMNPWTWIAFTIAGMAQVASMISQIHSLSGYAEGGIIQGKTTIGDRNLARVNAGEMILNHRQQNHLFKMIDEGRTTNNSMAGNVSFRIAGKELVGVLKNYNDKMNKVK